MKEFTNQILVTDKVFITPEFKVRKKAYKWNFIISVFLICCLFSYYIYAEYDKNKSEEVSQQILADINFEVEEPAEIASTMKTKDDVIIVALDAEDQNPYFTAMTEKPEINLDDLTVQKRVVFDTSVRTANDGTEYSTIALIDIPKVDVHYPIIAPVDKNLKDYTAILKISPCRYFGPDPNEVGNLCIVGHNYRNEKFFSRVARNTEIGDIIIITDAKGKEVTYKVYDRYIVDPTNLDCTNQNTNGKREITLITCTNDSKQRIILKCVEE